MPRKSNLKIVFILIAFLLMGLGIYQFIKINASSKQPKKPSSIPVHVKQTEIRDVPHLTRGIGNVQSQHSVNIKPQIDGVLTEIFYKEGEVVKKGALLATIDDRALVASLNQVTAEKQRLNAQLKIAEMDLHRQNNLFQQDATSKQLVDQQVALVAQLKASLASADAMIAAAKVQLSFTKITSPISGKIGIRQIDPGNFVKTSDVTGLVTITQITPIYVTFSLPQELLPRIQKLVNNKEFIPVTALDQDQGQKLGDGQLVTIDNQIDQTTGTVRIKAEFANKEQILWPGQSVAIQIRTGLSLKALVVPASAVQQGLDKLFVYRIKNNKAEAAPVTVQYQNDEIAVIGSGLALQDSVVIDGQSRLKPGATVSIVR